MGVTITQGSEMSMGVDNGILRVAVIGMGQRSAIARHVAEAVAADPALQAQVVAVADVTAAGRERGRAEYPDALVVEHHRDLTDQVDAAIVTTPDWTHAEIAIDLLRAGIAVYL